MHRTNNSVIIFISSHLDWADLLYSPAVRSISLILKPAWFIQQIMDQPGLHMRLYLKNKTKENMTNRQEQYDAHSVSLRNKCYCFFSGLTFHPLSLAHPQRLTWYAVLSGCRDSKYSNKTKSNKQNPSLLSQAPLSYT